MKLVREHINEKFTEDSDPIHDMGIGMDALIKNFIKETGYLSNTKKNFLQVCAAFGKTEFVKYLLDSGADVHRDDDAPLRWASEMGRTEVVKLLLDAGADVHAQNDAPLRWASERGCIKIVKLLLDAGADVHAKNDWALRYAKQNFHFKTLKLLKNHIAKEKKGINEKFTEDSDPIHDMGIGLYVKRNFKSLEELFLFLYENLASILKRKKIPEDIFYVPNINTVYNWKYYDKIEKYCKNYILLNNERWNFIYLFAKYLEKRGYVRKVI